MHMPYTALYKVTRRVNGSAAGSQPTPTWRENIGCQGRAHGRNILLSPFNLDISSFEVQGIGQSGPPVRGRRSKDIGPEVKVRIGEISRYG